MCVPEDRKLASPATLLPTDQWQGLEKTIPDTPSNLTPVHLRDYQIFAQDRYVLRSGEADVGIPKDKAKA